MPNHVSCELTASPGILDLLASGEGKTAVAIDFEKILPCPEVVLRDSVREDLVDWAKIAVGHTNLASLFRPDDLMGSLAQDPLTAFHNGNYGPATEMLRKSNVSRMLSEGPFPKDLKDADFERFIQMIRALRATGFAYWYDWNIANWGTKWNAYETKRVSETVVTFETAWSAPVKVIVALSDRYPIEDIRLRWADEDFGSNVGDVTFKGGLPVIEQEIEDGSREAYDLAVELIHGGTLPDDMQRNDDGSVSYIEDGDEAVAG